MSKHTQGKWEVGYDKDRIGHYVIQENGGIIATISDYVFKNDVAGNSRLISAAPELLEALKQALSYIKGDYIDADGIEEKLANVIKKAEGNQ